MILPTKGIGPDKALLSVGAFILRELDEPKTVSRLWSDLRRVEEGPPALTFDWFVLSLDLLYLMGTLDYIGGRVVRVGPVEAEGEE
ncbi:ABC-three component system middle component 6 [Thiohalomonas denitrificans]|uniref:ABC-three component system middle component 6 n=1 Tax=Thiohalomonas denitrificans TaxID=415747 RepID=UPI0026F0234E|nr:ABC-three component system middle component 6 [Thiohalomonas denitrificans]